MAALLLEHGAGSRTLLDRQDEVDERAARRSLQLQVAQLDRLISAAICEAFPDRLELPAAPTHGPRLQSLGQLELLRDQMIGSLREAREALAARELQREASRELLARMLLDPGSHRRVRISQRELGVGGCGVWSVSARLGPMGRLMGWWRVKLSSGCPLAT
ncbi:unannotated protein [freshwater metagenome]|uniref:Unannotated protein n=1 Tax=freshwater metagenome TaxID=449393 RepID=A0A6J5ZY51_9ZZZZ|nr:hypothetical protein [Actinomycetota bacterium]